MMGRQNQDQGQLFYSFDLDAAVPTDHLVREIAHKGNIYPGQHEAIVDQETWASVQEKLAANRRARSLALNARIRACSLGRFLTLTDSA